MPLEGKIEGKYPFEGVVEAKIEGKEEAKIEGKGPHIEGKVEAKGPFVEGKLEAKPDHFNGHEGKPDHPWHEAKPDHPGPVHDSHPVHNGAPSNHPVHEAKPDSPVHEAKVDEINEHKNGSLSYDKSSEGWQDFHQPSAGPSHKRNPRRSGIGPVFQEEQEQTSFISEPSAGVGRTCYYDEDRTWSVAGDGHDAME